jgi:tetratricopeptide (TPR) repeat protein
MIMQKALAQIGHAQKLSDTGHFAAVVEFLDRESRDTVERSPTLALLKGIAHGRLGDYERAREWVVVSLDRARELADDRVEARALNVLGAIGFECGIIEEATLRFQQGLEAAKLLDDAGIMGRCANNLGILASLRGDHRAAIASFTRALAVFEQAGLVQGTAEALHNLGISYRDLGDYARALEHADRAVQTATEAGDLVLVGQAWAGRAETRARSGDARLARREAETALSTHQQLGDAIGEMDDLRILALTLGSDGDLASAERTLHDVIDRAESLERPLLVANARRDLAHLLHRQGRYEEMGEVADQARAQFVALGAMGQARSLDELTSHRG